MALIVIDSKAFHELVFNLMFDDLINDRDTKQTKTA